MPTAMASFVMISRCSGAILSDTSTASSTLDAITAKPFLHASVAVSLLGDGMAASCLTTSELTASTSCLLVDTRMGLASTSCSACASRSAATVPGSAVSSQMTSTSLGPASMSIAVPDCDTRLLAAVTHWLPGPTMMSHLGTGPMPCESVATACAPPTLSIPSALATWAAAIVTWSGWGLATHTCLTPAARAVQAVMSTDEGRGYLPPGA
mmetsp:Transcript_50617/g.126023  ORF Transcript_50617/g.126023 Transcript_50617/m.126023 type:complete len:210 (-) Transcript_50617:455-1084(-)